MGLLGHTVYCLLIQILMVPTTIQTTSSPILVVGDRGGRKPISGDENVRLVGVMSVPQDRCHWRWVYGHGRSPLTVVHPCALPWVAWAF